MYVKVLSKVFPSKWISAVLDGARINLGLVVSITQVECARPNLGLKKGIIDIIVVKRIQFHLQNIFDIPTKSQRSTGRKPAALPTS